MGTVVNPKKFTMKSISIFLVLVLISLSAHSQTYDLIDKNASEETKALFSNLRKVQEEGKVLFGHQDATVYGRSWNGDKDRSDVKDLVGSHPAVIGLDFGNVTEANTDQFLKEKERLVRLVVDTYNRGGISTFA